MFKKRIILSKFDSTVGSFSKPNTRQANLYADVEEFANSYRKPKNGEEKSFGYHCKDLCHVNPGGNGYWLSAKQVEESELETVTLNL